jgi:sugar phosphate isomerase/epimerase
MRTSSSPKTALLIGFLLLQAPVQAALAEKQRALLERTNLVAWCIVPFDAKKRGPEERALMLNRLGIRQLAYDWRQEHIPTFDDEVETCRRHQVNLLAWWFPSTLDAEAKAILNVIEQHGLKTQLWVTGGGSPTKNSEEQRKRVVEEAGRLRPIAERALKLGCQVGLYNHGSWFGEPENAVAIIKELNLPNVGIVYNFHHGHDHIGRFAEAFRIMQPYLLCVNLNGMVMEGERLGRKILPLGQGDQELGMLCVILQSGWQGPIGIIDHRPETDSEETLRENLHGLDRLRKELEAPAAGATLR